MLDMGADYTDGIRLNGRGYRLHISPLCRAQRARGGLVAGRGIRPLPRAVGKGAYRRALL